ncbi:MAG: c-type cytochrome, partial [Paracoccaceae bacterium]
METTRQVPRLPRAPARMLAAVAIALTVLGLLDAAPAGAADRPSGPKPEATPELVEQGRAIYFRRCSFCHGLLGDGNGPAADYLDPRPRDFTLGTFKFRTTQSGELPTDEDLFRTVSRGLPGTAMQAFDSDRIKNGLSEAERWAVISYIKTFALEFDDPEFDPYGMQVALPANMPPYDADSIAKGAAVFERAKCWECHGRQGRGDGQKAFDRKDDWGFP